FGLPLVICEPLITRSPVVGSEPFALRLANLAAHRPNPPPHGVEEQQDSRDLRKAEKHYRPAQPERGQGCSHQFPQYSPACAYRQQPIRRFRYLWPVALVLLVRPRKEPERHTEYHHHHEAHEQRVGVRAGLIRRREAHPQLPAHYHPAADSQPNRKKQNRCLDIASNQSVHVVPFGWKSARGAMAPPDYKGTIDLGL